jgi:hypothetical protein
LRLVVPCDPIQLYLIDTAVQAFCNLDAHAKAFFGLAAPAIQVSFHPKGVEKT